MASTVRLNIGSIINERYEVLSRIGEGGFSLVYKARQLSTSQDVAIKVLRAERMDEVGRGESQVARFQREMNLIGRMRHPHIVRLLDSGSLPSGQVFTVLELVDGESLASLLGKKERLPSDESYRLMGQVLDALCCAHHEGVVHRDLKPENIMITSTGGRKNVQVLDFGVSGLLRSFRDEKYRALTMTGEFYGTPSYMAPEQLLGEELTERTDIYAWGLIFLEMLLGYRVVDGASPAQVMSRHLSSAPTPIPDALLKHPLGQFLRRVTAKDHRVRPATAQQALAELESIDPAGLQVRPRYESVELMVAPTRGSSSGWGLQEDTIQGMEPTTCRACGALNPPGMDYCGGCGATQGRSPESAPSWPAISRSEGLPRTRSVRQHLIALAGELRFATVSGEEADPYDLLRALRAFHQAAEEVLGAQRGFLARNDGEEFTVYFGYPRHHEDDALRALRTARGLFEVAGGACASLLRELGLRVMLRCGVHCGMVVVSRTSSREMPLLLGGVPQTARSAMAKASAGEILIGEPMRRLVKGAFVLRARGEVEAAWGEPRVPIYLVQEERRGAAGAVSLVGRGVELGLLGNLWRQVKAGRGQAASLIGAAGIGKSLILQTFLEKIQGEDCVWWKCACAPEFKHSAYHSLLVGLRERLSSASLGALEELLSDLQMDVEEHLPWLALLLSISLEGSRYELPAFGPPRSNMKILEALCALWFALAEEKPLVLLVEDLHWADSATLGALEALVEQVSVAPVFLLTSARPSFPPPWSSRSHVTSISLNRLTRHEVDEMARAAAGEKSLSDEVLALVRKRTDGVPLFVEEFVRALLDADVMTQEGDVWGLKQEVPDELIPSTLRSLISARLDHLGEARDLASLASVLGREFSYGVLRALWGGEEEELQPRIRYLVEAGVLQQKGRFPRAMLSFRHALVRDGAYDALLAGERRSHHQRAASALLTASPELAVLQPEMLAHHLTLAGEPNEALTYWKKAGESASQRSANTEAAHNFQESLRLLRLQPREERSLELELELLLKLGGALVATSGYASSRIAEVFGQAYDLCKKLGGAPQRFPVLWGLWVYYHTRGQFSLASELGHGLMTLADVTGDSGVRLEAHNALGATAFCAGDAEESLQHLFEGALRYEEEKHHKHALMFGHDPNVFSIAHASWALWNLGRYREAHQCAERALNVARRLAHPNSLGFALHFAAGVYQLSGDVNRVERYAQELSELAQREVLPFWMAGGQIWTEWVATQRGESPEGLMRGIAGWRGVGAEIVVPRFVSMAAEEFVKRGSLSRAESILGDALAQIERSGGRCYESEVRRVLASLHGSRGEMARAEQEFWRAIEAARVVGARGLELRAASHLLSCCGGDEPVKRYLETLLKSVDNGVRNVDLEKVRRQLS